MASATFFTHYAPYIFHKIDSLSFLATFRNSPYSYPPPRGKRPLHLDAHGGGFIGGIPEDSAPLCSQIAESTGAVVVSVTYRFAPLRPFPCAHDDIADVFLWLLDHATEEFGADTEIVTISGISAGGNLVLGGTLGAKDARGRNIVKGAVTFYSPVDLRLPPQEKRKPRGWPSFDPLWFMLPLFDSYAGPGRIRNIEDPRLHPTLASLADLPADMLFVIPTIDFLMYEQLDMVERLQKEAVEEAKKGASYHNSRRIEKLVFEGQWHGWLELPSWAIDESTRRKAFISACDFLGDVHRKNGFDINELASEKKIV
ncbi:MAG: hypothetical protein Q9209_002376 [Squamulea sp. 1 TL-2023]